MVRICFFLYSKKKSWKSSFNVVVGFEGFVGYKRIGGESSRRTFLLEMIFNVLYFGKISYDYDFEIFVEIVNNSLFFLTSSFV